MDYIISCHGQELQGSGFKLKSNVTVNFYNNTDNHQVSSDLLMKIKTGITPAASQIYKSISGDFVADHKYWDLLPNDFMDQTQIGAFSVPPGANQPLNRVQILMRMSENSNYGTLSNFIDTQCTDPNQNYTIHWLCCR